MTFTQKLPDIYVNFIKSKYGIYMICDNTQNLLTEIIYLRGMKMKKTLLTPILLFSIGLIFAGCANTANADTKKVASINTEAQKIINGKDNQQKVKDLKNFEKTAKKSNKQSKTVKDTYDESISKIQQSIKKANHARIKSDGPSKSPDESHDSLEKKLSDLKDLQKEIKEQQKVVYSSSEFKELKKSIDRQMTLSTDKLSEQMTMSSSSKQSSKQSNKEQPKKKIQAPTSSKKMNLSEISHGNFTSLMGEWKEVAEGANGYHGIHGFSWIDEISNAPLSISAGQLSDQQITVKVDPANNEISMDQNGQTGTVNIQNGTNLSFNANVGAFNSSIDFYPSGVNTGDNAKMNLDKEHIVFRTSNNGFTEVFERI